MPDKPNILLIAIDSIRADHMSCYGYKRLTTPHIDRFAQSGALFENTFSPHIPTTPAYASMLTGLDCFGTQVVALRHKGPLRPEAPTAAEIFGAMATTRRRSASRAIPARAASTTTSNSPAGAAMNLAAAPKRKTLTT